MLKKKEIWIKGSIVLLFVTFFGFYVKGFMLYHEQHGNHPLVFGATYMTMNNQFYDVLNTEIRHVVEKRGDHLITLDPALDQDKQNAQIEYLIAQDADVIFLNPVDWKGVEPGLLMAKEAGIPVIVVDTPVYRPELVSVTIVSDNYQAGVLCAQDMMKKRKKADIVLLTHEEAKSALDRIAGFLDTIGGRQEYRIIAVKDSQGQIERALPKMKKILEEHPAPDVIMALNDPAAMGALAALDQKKCRESVLVYGVDGSPEAKKLIQDHMMTGSAVQFPKKMGKKAVQTAYALLEGKKVEKEILMPVELVTEETIEQFEIDRWQ